MKTTVYAEAKRRHERSVCRVAVELLARRIGGKPGPLVWVEDFECTRPAVELRLDIGSKKVVLEHTRIESFPEQIGDDKRSTEFLQPIISELGGRLPTPGYYHLGVRCGAVNVLRGKRDKMLAQDAVIRWAISKAPLLALDPRGRTTVVREQPAGVPFEVYLDRLRGTGRHDGMILPVLCAPGDREPLRRARIQRAFRKKLPKLQVAREAAAFEGEGMSILVLESCDLSCAREDLIGDAVAKGLASRAGDVPDVIYLVETEMLDEWVVWVLKEGTAVFPNVPDDGPHCVPPVPSSLPSGGAAR